jgi:hypothetical protein
LPPLIHYCRIIILKIY